VGSLRCGTRPGRRFGAHLEIFANRFVVLIPPGVGVAPPLVRVGAYVRRGRCSYPARTLEPTGVIEVGPRSGLSLGDFFDLWGQPLSRGRVVGFHAGKGERVHAFVGGREWSGDPRDIPLERRTVIVLEVRGHLAPHRRYRFPPGL
jgi:hypothetical protein